VVSFSRDRLHGSPQHLFTIKSRRLMLVFFLCYELMPVHPHVDSEPKVGATTGGINCCVFYMDR
jgi:hypothetical protein